MGVVADPLLKSLLLKVSPPYPTLALNRSNQNAFASSACETPWPLVVHLGCYGPVSCSGPVSCFLERWHATYINIWIDARGCQLFIEIKAFVGCASWTRGEDKLSLFNSSMFSVASCHVCVSVKGAYEDRKHIFSQILPPQKLQMSSLALTSLWEDNPWLQVCKRLLGVGTLFLGRS